MFIILFFSLQVHRRIKYLRHLIVSLAQAKDISKTLLVFSHDFYDEEINDLVQTIDFCKVIQVSFSSVSLIVICLLIKSDSIIFFSSFTAILFNT